MSAFESLDGTLFVSFWFLVVSVFISTLAGVVIGVLSASRTSGRRP